MVETINNTFQTTKRILAIDPANRGFGYAVMEGSEKLIDWGVREIRDNKNARYLKKVAELIEQYQPDAIAVEDFSGKGSRRCKRVQELITRIIELASERKIKIKCISKSDIRNAFSQFNVSTKCEIAIAIANHLSELSLRLPPFRKPWMSEDYRMGIFDSVAFALTFYHLNKQKVVSKANHSNHAK